MAKKKKRSLGNPALVATAALPVINRGFDSYDRAQELKHRSFTQEKSTNINNSLMWLGIAGIGSFFAYKAYKQWQSGANERNQKAALDQLTALDSAEAVTITNAEAVSYANKLLAAFDRMGTDEDSVRNILLNSGLTNNDVKLIVKAFGIQKYGTFGKAMWGGTLLDLMGWIREEISGTLLADLQVRFAKAGLTV
jgi:hypothetical protein